MNRLLTIAVMCVAFMSGVIGAADALQASDQKTPAKPEGKPAVAVETVKVSAGEIRESIDVVGTLSPKFSADVKTEYPGIVKEVFVAEWVRVKKGDKLIRLDDREPKALLSKTEAAVEMAKAGLLQAKVEFQRADREYNRLMKLMESGLATQQSLDEAGTAKEAAAARQKVSQAQLNAAQQELQQVRIRFAKTVITAPIDGIIEYRAINVGDLTSDKPLFKIVDNRLLELTVTVPSKYMRNLKPGQPLVFSTDAFPGQAFKGKVMYINPSVNETDRSVKVIAEVPNDPEVLKGGLFVEGKIITGERSSALHIPRAAILSWDIATQQADVFVVKNGTVERCVITTGIVSGDQVEILSGLTQGEDVIVRGAFTVKEGDRVTITGTTSESR